MTTIVVPQAIPARPNVLAILVGGLALVVAAGSLALAVWLLLDPTPVERSGDFVERIFRALLATAGSPGLLLGLATLLWIDPIGRRLGQVAVALWGIGLVVSIVAQQRTPQGGVFDLPLF